jgi:hypothetical protein
MYQQKQIDMQVQAKLDSIYALLREKMDNDAETLKALLDSLNDNRELQEAWLAGDRDLLLKTAQPIFRDLSSKYRTTHFYFHSTDKTCFLRVHNPTRFGDTIDRITMHQASDTGKISHGIELGPLGTFTLRVVYPWHINGQLTGFLELGEEMDYIVPHLSRVLDAELIILIKKAYLNREDWEEGRQILGLGGNWDQLVDFVLTENTLPTVNLPLLRKVSEMEHHDHADPLFNLVQNGKHYRGGFIELYDVGHRGVGELLLLKDITILENEVLHVSIFVMGTTLLMIGMISFFLYYFLTPIFDRHKQSIAEQKSYNSFARD